jgi:hypothetical protein
MPADRIVYSSAFGPEDIAEIVAAYESACRQVGSVNRNDHIRDFLARRVMSAAMTGERRAAQICERALVGVGQTGAAG